MEAIRYSGMWVLTRATRRHIPEDGILHVSYSSHMRASSAQAKPRYSPPALKFPNKCSRIPGVLFASTKQFHATYRIYNGD
jgi:hypothetical protein